MLDFAKMAYPDDPRISLDGLKYQQIYIQKYDIISELNDIRFILEVGVRAGYSAFTFLQAFPGAALVGIDANNGTHGGQGGENGRYMKWAQELLAPYNAIIFEYDTQELTDLSLIPFDFIHIDGDHTPDGVYHDLDICLPALAKAGTILVDDYTYLSTVKKGVDRWLLMNNDRVAYEILDTIRGDVLIRHRNT